VGGDLDLAEKPLWPDRSGQRGMEHLDRDLPVMLEVFGEVDRPHAAVAELALEPGDAKLMGGWSEASSM
jgi:hypothetical protein